MTIYCLGRNYAAHAKEMGSSADAEGEPVVFVKPAAALLLPPGPIRFPKGAGEIHHEVEIVLRVGRDRRPDAVAVGLDLTDRTRQGAAKKAGMPWAAAKGFRGSAPMGPFVPIDRVPALDRLRFSLAINGSVKQRGDTALALRPAADVLAYLDSWFGLEPGDLVYTGTPEGVGPIRSGDVLDLTLEGVPAASSRFTVA